MRLSGLFESAVYLLAEFRNVERFTDEIKCAKCHRFRRQLQGIQTRKHYHFASRVDVFDLPQYLNSISSRHDDIEQNNLGFFVLNERNGAVYRFRFQQPVVFTENHFQRLTDAHFVIDDQ
jgi:hypothetical protein